MNATEAMQQIDVMLSHVWMVRTFLKHSDEAAEDEELREVHRGLYDFALALGSPLRSGDADTYLKTASKKLSKFTKAVRLFCDIQPEVSTHTNFQMAVVSLSTARDNIESLINQAKTDGLLG